MSLDESQPHRSGTWRWCFQHREAQPLVGLFQLYRMSLCNRCVSSNLFEVLLCTFVLFRNWFSNSLSFCLRIVLVWVCVARRHHVLYIDSLAWFDRTCCWGRNQLRISKSNCRTPDISQVKHLLINRPASMPWVQKGVHIFASSQAWKLHVF